MNVTPIQSCYAGRASQRWNGSPGPLRDGSCSAGGGSGSGADGKAPSTVPFQLQPPWKVLPWPKHVGPINDRPAVAVVVVQPTPGLADVTAVGRTLDLFV